MASHTRRPSAGGRGGSRKGTGGHGRRALEGKGPTPPAEERTYHPAYRRKQAHLAREAAARRPGSRRPASRLRPEGSGEVMGGRNAVLEALRAHVPTVTVYLSPGLDADERIREILDLANVARLPVLEASRSELDALTEGESHQGVVAVLEPYRYRDLEELLDAAFATDTAPLFVALDGVTDPRNLGAVLRSAGAFGADGLIVPERRAAGVTAAAWKTSAGAAAYVPVARVVNLPRALTQLRRAGCFAIGLDGKAETRIADLPFATDPLVLVVGSEGKGLSRLVRETCDALAAIPIDTSKAQSLNASVAAAIALYEIAQARQQGAG